MTLFIGVGLMASIFILTLILITASILSDRKTKYNKNMSLYNWLDDLNDFDENLIYLLKNTKISYGTLDNLISVKKILKKQTGSDKDTLKLYRAYYNQKSTESGEELYLKTIMIVILPALIVLPSSGILKLPPTSSLLLVIPIFIFVAIISIKLVSNKKRHAILVDLIDLCIEDIDHEDRLEKDRGI
ncbi:Uncharacterised protein [Lysinibacillus sphaericus]|nr:Uncharacterised protein [Lysinibacillus sphaericus]